MRLPFFHANKTATRYTTLTLEHRDAIATITLNRPEKKNAISFLMMHELIQVAKHLKKDKKLRAVIITGADDTFSSGLDLSDLNNPKNLGYALWQLAKPTMSVFQRLCLIWQSLPVPVIAVIDGVCVGAGLQLALGADIRIASPRARFAILEAKWGLVADMGLTHSARGIAPDVLKQLAMSAQMVSGDDAKALGLITQLSDTPLADAHAYIKTIQTRSPDAVLAAKRIVNAMHPVHHRALYLEKLWQLKLLLGNNRKLALKRAHDDGVAFIKRQFR